MEPTERTLDEVRVSTEEESGRGNDQKTKHE